MEDMIFGGKKRVDERRRSFSNPFFRSCAPLIRSNWVLFLPRFYTYLFLVPKKKKKSSFPHYYIYFFFWRCLSLSLFSL